jgi:tRNA-dihydrouridine synthase B
VLQIAGSEPEQLAAAARAAADLGADIVDINMGCPAKKVCKKLSGSALLQDEDLVERILNTVTAASKLPVTLKMRTGWNPLNRNGVRVARLAEQAGIQALAVHGRTRECMFKGEVEFETIRQIKRAVKIPVFANGDITDIEKAHEVLDYTGADAVMIGRGALGRPWIFRDLNPLLNQTMEHGQKITRLSVTPQVQRDTILLHLNDLHRFYGKERGVLVGRKHLTWYCKYLNGAEEFRTKVVRIDNAATQLQFTADFFEQYFSSGSGVDKTSQSLGNLFSGQERFQKEVSEPRQESRT